MVILLVGTELKASWCPVLAVMDETTGLGRIRTTQNKALAMNAQPQNYGHWDTSHDRSGCECSPYWKKWYNTALQDSLPWVMSNVMLGKNCCGGSWPLWWLMLKMILMRENSSCFPGKQIFILHCWKWSGLMELGQVAQCQGCVLKRDRGPKSHLCVPSEAAVSVKPDQPWPGGCFTHTHYSLSASGYWWEADSFSLWQFRAHVLVENMELKISRNNA